MKINHSQKGFTLVEALVAIFILLVAIVLPIDVAYQGIAATTYAENQLVAQYLAQDATEYLYARQIEDPSGWYAKFSTQCATANGCTLSTDSVNTSDGTEAVACQQAPCPVLWYNSGTGVYSKDSGGSGNAIATSYSREIKLEQLSSSDNTSATEVRATITISWGTSLAAKKTFVLITNFYAKSS